MNEKLILRAASHYRQWLLSQELHQIQDRRAFVMGKFARAQIKSKQIEEWANRFFTGTEQRFQQSDFDNKTHRGIVSVEAYEDIATTMVPDLWLDMTRDTQYAVSMLKKLVGHKTIIQISNKEALEEMRAIVYAWKEVKFRNGFLSVKTAEITLSDEDDEVFLGSFWMCLDLSNPLDSLRIEAIDCIENENGYCHPHVQDTSLCLGEGSCSSKEAICQGRLEDYFRIIEAVLQTYNENSPHDELKEWYDPNHEGQFSCEGCEEWRSDDISCYCSECQRNYCEHCDSGGGCCTSCNDWRCEDCSTSCTSCGETLCCGCANTCNGCGEQTCENCLTSCNVCHESYCDKCCSESCTNCGDKMCEKCTATCGCCGENNCAPCACEQCTECKTNICKGCQTTCDECEKTICEMCEDNQCVDCGVPMCESCVESHTCLLSEVKNA